MADQCGRTVISVSFSLSFPRILKGRPEGIVGNMKLLLAFITS